MKRIYQTGVLGLILAVFLLEGCAEADGGKKDSGILYGEVLEVLEDGILVDVETIEEISKSQDEEEEPQEIAFELKKTGKEKEITVTKDTVISRESKKNINLSNISKGDTVSVVFDKTGEVGKITVLSMDGTISSEPPDSYEAMREFAKDTEKVGDEVVSVGVDENAIHAYGGAIVKLTDFKVVRSSDASKGEGSMNLFGVGAAVLDTEGMLYVKGGTVNTDASGAAGIFAYGDGTVYVADTKIATQKNSSGGIHAADSGSLYAWNVEAVTNGNDSSALRSSGNGAVMVVNGGTFISNGIASPAIHCMADTAVNGAAFVANKSEAASIEGLGALRLYNCSLTGNMAVDKRNDCTWNVALYQGTSGEPGAGNSIFEMNGGSLTAQSGGMFYTTNTESTFVLSGVKITYAEANEFFLRCTGNNSQKGWGTPGENGANCRFSAFSQNMEGDIIWDSISTLDMDMRNGSTLTGAIIDDETYTKDTGEGYCNLYLDKGCAWVVTGDSVLTVLENGGTIVDRLGKSVTIEGKDGTVYEKGDSGYVITVETYIDSADVSGASEPSQWADYEVERPEGF